MRVGRASLELCRSPHQRRIGAGSPPLARSTVKASDLESPNIFISYAREDSHHVRRLRALLGAVVGEDAVFADQDSVRAGSTWTLELARAIVNSTHFVVVWSSSARDSHWVNQEVSSAVELAHEQPLRRIIPVRVDPTPLPEELEPFEGIDLFGEKAALAWSLSDGVQLVLAGAIVGALGQAIHRYDPVQFGLVAMWLALAAFAALRFAPRCRISRVPRAKRKRLPFAVTPRALKVLFAGGCLCAAFALGRVLLGRG